MSGTGSRSRLWAGRRCSGASQVTCKLVLDSRHHRRRERRVRRLIVLTSVTLIVTLTASVPPLPSRALTATE